MTERTAFEGVANFDALVAERAVTARERVCVAGDGFTLSANTTQAITIGAWHYTGDGYDACRDT